MASSRDRPETAGLEPSLLELEFRNFALAPTLATLAPWGIWGGFQEPQSQIWSSVRTLGCGILKEDNRMAGEAIFIGYRRDDTADVAGRIYDAMARRFGKQRIFKDVDNIGPGVDFGDYIKRILPRCRVALVLIGPHWLDSKDENGLRRIDDHHDWVRVEIETALSTPDLLVVPVLVNGASMPLSEEVPESLRPLLRRNAASIRRDPDFHDDVKRLATAIRRSVNTGSLDLSKLGGKAGAPAAVLRESVPIRRDAPCRAAVDQADGG
jgi:hypothetical protein